MGYRSGGASVGPRGAGGYSGHGGGGTRRAGLKAGPWRRFRSKRPLAQFGYVVVTITAALAIAVAVTGYVIYERLNGNITKVDVAGLSGKTIYGTLNILVLGSQERTGQHGHFGYEANPGTTNSDNLLLVHLDPTHTHATVLSIPRDLFVYEPACKKRAYVGTGIMPAQTYPPGAIIDGALNIGGPTCAVKTVEDLTGIKLDHVIVFDFNSFRRMVDALGGVDVCVPPGPGYHDSYSNLNLTPGVHKLTYNQALAYVRTRHGVGTGADAGGDLPRIQLQQAFISSVVQKVTKEGLLSNFTQLYHLAEIATKALTVDQGLASPLSLLHLARSLTHLKSKDVSLLTLPTVTNTYPGLSSHLMALQPQDDVLYQMLRTGARWHGRLPTVPFSKVQVEVLNGTGRTGLAGRTAAALRKLGFDVTSVGDAPSASTTTVDFRGEVQADNAYTLMTALNSLPEGQNTLNEPAAQIGRPGQVVLTLGTDFSGVNPLAGTHVAKSTKRKKKTSTGSAVQSRNAGANICSGLPPANARGGQRG